MHLIVLIKCILRGAERQNWNSRKSYRSKQESADSNVWGFKSCILFSPGLILFLFRQAEDETLQTLRKHHCQWRQSWLLYFSLVPPPRTCCCSYGMAWDTSYTTETWPKAEVRPEITVDCVLWAWQLLVSVLNDFSHISAALIAISVILAGTLNSLLTLN